MSLRRKAKIVGPPILTFHLKDILCASPPWSSVSETSVWILRLGDIRLDPPSRGHPSGSSVSGTSAWILRLRDIRLDPPCRGHPSGSSVSGTSVWILRLGDIRLEHPYRGHPSRPSNHINGSYFNHHSHGNLYKYKKSLILRERVPNG